MKNRTRRMLLAAFTVSLVLASSPRASSASGAATCGWKGTIGWQYSNVGTFPYSDKESAKFTLLGDEGATTYDATLNYTFPYVTGTVNCTGHGTGNTGTSVTINRSSGTYWIALDTAQSTLADTCSMAAFNQTLSIMSGPGNLPILEQPGLPWDSIGSDPFHLEGHAAKTITNSSVGVTITATLDWNLDYSCPVNVGVDGMSDADKQSVGGLVVMKDPDNDNSVPRKKITLAVSEKNSGDFPGDVLLTWPDTNIRIYSAAGTPIAQDGTQNRFAGAALPLDFEVEGAGYSKKMRDVKITGALAEHTDDSDYANFTVLWIETPKVRFSGALSANNAVRGDYAAKYQTTKLGAQLIYPPAALAVGVGYEVSAAVHPKSFQYPGAELMLDRDIQDRDYTPALLSEPGLFDDYSSVTPIGNDGGPGANDADPAPNDTIYDYDLPELGLGHAPYPINSPPAAVGDVFSERFNAHEYASVTLAEWPLANPSKPGWEAKKWVRCSPIQSFFVRASAIKVAPDGPHGERHWKLLTKPNPKAVTNDNQGCLGQTDLSKTPASFAACQ